MMIKLNNSLLSPQLSRTNNTVGTLGVMPSIQVRQNVASASNVYRPPVSVDLSTLSTTSKPVNLSLSSTNSPPSAAEVIDYTNNIKQTGDKTIDPLLAGGNYWWNTGPGADGEVPSTSADHTLTYSFLSSSAGLNTKDATGFQALDSNQQNAFKAALAYISTVADITFTEVASGSGQLNFGSNNQGGASGGYAYYPNSGAPSGNLLIANDQASFADTTSWDEGGYEWTTVIHELGHALGLKHPGKYNAGGGELPPKPYLPRSKDNLTNSIMSYREDNKYMKYVYHNGTGLTSKRINPESFQNYDIAALQYLYGAASNPTPKTYTFTDNAVFSKTIYDANSSSVIDLSGMNQDNVIDLRGGRRSSVGLRDPYAATGMTEDQYKKFKSNGVRLTKLLGKPTYSGENNLGIAKGSQIRTVVGGNGKDSFVSGNEIGGAAQLDGGAGDDKFFIASGDADIADTSGTSDTLYIKKQGGTYWTLNSSLATLTQTDKEGNVLSTVNISGVENVGFWNGKKIKSGRRSFDLSTNGQKNNLVNYLALKPKKSSSKINIEA